MHVMALYLQCLFRQINNVLKISLLGLVLGNMLLWSCLFVCVCVCLGSVDSAVGIRRYVNGLKLEGKVAVMLVLQYYIFKLIVLFWCSLYFNTLELVFYLEYKASPDYAFTSKSEI